MPRRPAPDSICPKLLFAEPTIKRLVLGAARAVDVDERAHLDRITDRRPGAMGFDIIDVARVRVNARQGQPYDFFLGLAVRRRKRRGMAILVDSGRHYARENSIVARQASDLRRNTTATQPSLRT